MENLLAHSHSILVHFTVGLFLSGFIVEIIGLILDHQKTQYAGALMLIMGGTAGLLTMYTGEYAEHNVEEILSSAGEEALEHHEEWGGWAGYFLFATALVRLGLFWFKHNLLRAGYFLLAGVSLVILLLTAHYGGQVTHADHPHTAVTTGQWTSAPATEE